MVQAAQVIGVLLTGLFAGLLMLKWRRLGERIVIACVGVTVAAAVLQPRDEPPRRFVPRAVKRENYVQSKTCQSCHPDAYATWHRTYHRTMTRLATPETVAAPFDGSVHECWGQKYRFERRGDEFWVHMPDLHWQAEMFASGINPTTVANPPTTWHRVVLVTGSHHLQVYWLAGVYPRQPIELPLYYSIDHQKWIPKNDSILTPPEPNVHYGSWNARCSSCHSIGATPGLDPQTGVYDTEVAEFGITCEACHGPGTEHARLHQNPINRYRYRLHNKPDPSIVNPSRCAPKVATQICGRCHSASKERDFDDYLQNGVSYRPGGKLEESYEMFEFDPLAVDSDEEMSNQFWKDGTCRVGGDEYEAFIKSPCYERGDLSCLSCHSMHHSDPNDQLAADMNTDQACLQCHESLRDNIEQHTHHDPQSSGSRCYNCHMPHTTYALFTAMRSHRIDSPSVASDVATGRPNACNLCHLDRTLKWTGSYLSQWYGKPEVELSEDQQQIAASLLWLLRGDAVQRVISAWHMGWKPAQEASGTDWQAPFLAHLLEDPYSIARFMAHHSLQKLPQFEGFEYDYIGPPEERTVAKRRALDIARASPRTARSGSVDQLLMDSNRTLRQQEIDRLLLQRDDRPVSIPE